MGVNLNITQNLPGGGGGGGPQISKGLYCGCMASLWDSVLYVEKLHTRQAEGELAGDQE